MKLVPRGKLDQEPLLRWLGPEPLGNEFDAPCWRARATARRLASRPRCSTSGSSPALATSMSARRSSARCCRPGAGLHRCDRSGAPNERAERLVPAIKTVLNDAITAGGSSLRDHSRTDGTLGDFQHNFRVYDREGKPCPTPGCKGTIKRIVQTGRSTFFCPVCQK